VNAGSSTFSTSATIDMSHPSVPSDTPSSLFQSERWDPGDGEEMQWAFPVVPGDYRVNLYFAEIYTGTFSVGARIFDVAIENSLVLNDLDVYGQVGGDTALVTSHDVTVTDSNLNIAFGHVVENPAVKAIEIISLQTQPGVLGVSPGLVDFGVVTVGDSVSDAVVLSNLGGSGDPQLTVTGVTLGGADAAGFSHDLVVPVVLGPGETATVNVAHTAADVGSKTASLSFTHDGSNSPTTVNLTAEDVNPGAEVASALVSVTADGGLNASTYTPGSFVVENTSSGGVGIVEVIFDLRGGLVTDAVFDPDGLAGDPVGKGFTPDSGGSATGLGSHLFGSAHDDGYDMLTVDFSDFDPGEAFTFSVDIDPTSIRGATQPGPNESGSVSGLELSGAPVTVTFTDGSTITGNLFGPTGLSLGEVSIEQTTTTTPVISIVGEPSPTTLTDPNITVRVTGTPGDTVELLHTESGLFLDGVPNGGYDIDPYESNSVIAINRHTLTIGPDGTTDLPIVLTSTSPETGINKLIATTTNPTTGTHTTNTLTIQHNPTPPPPTLEVSPTTVDFGKLRLGQSKSVTVTITNTSTTQSVTISSIAITGPNSGQFSHNLSVPAVLAPGEKLNLSVTDKASIRGKMSVTLATVHDGSNSPINVSLKAHHLP
jgi:hypothetical protein